MAHEGVLPWPLLTVREYVAARRAAGFPAVHHSDAFRAAYAPAYRVVRMEFVEGLGLRIAQER